MIPAESSRTDLALPRFLAVILFGIAAIMGIPTAAVALGCLFAGKWRVALIMISIWPIVWATVWLARVIWSGRSIPMWFVFTLAGLFSAAPAAALLVKGEWIGALATVGLFMPFLMMLWSGMRTTYKATAKPTAFDEFA